MPVNSCLKKLGNNVHKKYGTLVTNSQKTLMELFLRKVDETAHLRKACWVFTHYLSILTHLMVKQMKLLPRELRGLSVAFVLISWCKMFVASRVLAPPGSPNRELWSCVYAFWSCQNRVCIQTHRDCTCSTRHLWADQPDCIAWTCSIYFLSLLRQNDHERHIE